MFLYLYVEGDKKFRRYVRIAAQKVSSYKIFLFSVPMAADASETGAPPATNSSHHPEEFPPNLCEEKIRCKGMRMCWKWPKSENLKMEPKHLPGQLRQQDTCNQLQNGDENLTWQKFHIQSEWRGFEKISLSRNLH